MGILKPEVARLLLILALVGVFAFVVQEPRFGPAATAAQAQGGHMHPDRQVEEQPVGLGAPATLGYVPQTREFLLITGEWDTTLKEDLTDRGHPRAKDEKLERYTFDPAALTVFLGDTVVLRIHDIKGSMHDVDIPDFAAGSPGAGIIDNRGNVLGQVAEDGLFFRGQEIRLISFVADQVGVFPIFCTVHDEAYEDDGLGSDDDDRDGVAGEPKAGPMVAYLTVLPPS